MASASSCVRDCSGSGEVRLRRLMRAKDYYVVFVEQQRLVEMAIGA